ncbi:MAG: tRNA lysidine(34) synthetase TilS [Dokdonella sp.]
MNALSIDAHLAVALDHCASNGPIAVGLSGGSDSCVLLHALAALPQARERGLRAIHVDHGLDADSGEWARQAVAMAAALGLACRVLHVCVERGAGIGPEAAARAARYAAWAGELASGEILALAHHRDDQVETLLLKLLRGASAEGLGAMRPFRALGSSWLWRPLLDLPRAALSDYAARHALAWIDDPSNTDQRLDRNYLRQRVLPLLRERWPQCDSVIARSADWQRATADYLANQIEQETTRLTGTEPATLRVDAWLAAPDAMRDGVLRAWLRRNQLTAPSHSQAVEVIRQMQTAKAGACPLVCWPGAEVRRYRGHLFAMERLPSMPSDWSHTFDGSPLVLPANLGTMVLESQAGFATPAPVTDGPWIARFRRGGERIQLAGETFHRELRDLFQQAGIPPWQRGQLPIISDADGVVLAVGDRWLAAQGDELWTKKDRHLRWSR